MPEEVHRLIQCAADHLKPIITIVVHAGMRTGEILGLVWDRIDKLTIEEFLEKETRWN